jgi:hypothetical protein
LNGKSIQKRWEFPASHVGLLDFVRSMATVEMRVAAWSRCGGWVGRCPEKKGSEPGKI